MLLIAATAAAFGPWLGFALAGTGAIASAMITYGIGAAIGRDAVETVMGPRLHRVRRSIAERGVLAVAAIRLVPIAPFTLVNLVAGREQDSVPRLRARHGHWHGARPCLDVRARPSDLEHHQRTDADQHIAFRPGGARLAHRFDRRAGFAAALEETQHLNRAGTTVRVMTWNIHSGVGTDGRFDLTRVVETIARHHPDVVALQEVDSRQTLAPARSAFAVLRDAVGEHGIEAKSIITADGAYGQMVVSRWPFGATQIHDITHAKREPRRAIEVEIATPTGAFRLIAAHFGLTLTERRQQARRLVAIARPHAMTTVMLGDFNEWFWPASLRGALGRELPARTQHPTFPSWYPLFRLDRIFCWPSGAMRASFVDRAARIVSDHLPVVADIEIG